MPEGSPVQSLSAPVTSTDDQVQSEQAAQSMKMAASASESTDPEMQLRVKLVMGTPSVASSPS